MHNTVIIDDMKEHIDRILPFLKNYPDQSIRTYQSVDEFSKDIHQFSNDTLFILDICIGENDGISIAKTIIEMYPSAQIIFISSFLDKALEVYEVKHCYFIYKPQLEHYLPAALAKAMDNLEDEQKYLSLQLKDKVMIIRFKDIIYIERNKRNTFVHSTDETVKTSVNLNVLFDQLPLYFVRSHNSFIFNIKYAKEIKRTSVILNDGVTIPVSRRYQNEVKKALHQYLINQL